MFISYLQSDPQFYFAVIIVVIVSVCLHELAHGFTAIALGDRTPEETGHITMNPIVHMGTTSLMLLAVTGLGWGAMPVDRTRLRGRYADTLVSFAGPATNLLLSLLATAGLGLWVRFGSIDRANHMVDNVLTLLWTAATYNLMLFVLNMLPIPPLDGSRIASDLSPGYRRLVSNPTMQGVSFALLMGCIFGIGRFVGPWAAEAVGYCIRLIAER